ncbi:MAG: prepilin peptidase [Rudaea sp.]|uniref:prepilin peptidase n=1 Tax=unclassified Rudaea TaxID=2627037 RepID=UPI0010F440E1|nr:MULTISPECIES: A24 family peptidase [unclassified Rudaea]MBN8887370.1 prepilin peptidase [Rudaea sp.]MBR0347229.1 prepilin peptidase [Rudaea sp.]
MLEFLTIPGVAVAVAGLLGLLVGSFLNVVILRLPARMMHQWREQSREMLELGDDDGEPAPPGLVWQASHCPQCKHTLGALENIPVLSWLVLRGRCKHCGTKISAQYPLVELLTGICSLLIVWKFGVSWQAAAGLLFTWSLIALAGIDVRTQLLPDQITLPLLWLGLLIALAPLFVDAPDAILGATIGYLSLWSVYWAFKLLTGKEGMGYGDFKLLGALGAWMGPWALLPIVLLSSLIGAVVGSTLLAVQGRDRATPIPFGPFLAAAGWVQFLFGAEILALYRYLFALA